MILGLLWNFLWSVVDWIGVGIVNMATPHNFILLLAVIIGLITLIVREKI